MKLLLTNLFLLLTFFTTAKAQLYVQVFDIGTGQQKLVPYVAGVTGVDKTYVDNSLKVLSATLINQISNVKDAQVINLTNQTWYKIITPSNYGKKYSNGTTQGRYFLGGYSDNAGVNFSTNDREDKVFTIAAYNILQPTGVREFPNEAGWDETIETHYDNPGSLPYGDFEWHNRIYPTTGGELRTSWYVNKATGVSRRDFTADAINFMTHNGLVYANLNDGVFAITASQFGRQVGFSAASKEGYNISITNSGGVYNLDMTNSLGNGWHKDGYGHENDGLSSYLNDADAISHGLKYHESYYRLINGVEVQTRVTTK